MADFILYDYWRSSAAYRVRIALAMKGLRYDSVAVDLSQGAQLGEDYKARNPQGFVPMLEHGSYRLTQSLAIIDYLDAVHGEHRLIPVAAHARADALASAMIVAADIHPVNNLRVMKYLSGEMGQSEDAWKAWVRHWVGEGFAALEARAPGSGFFGGGEPNIADVFLVPQMYNARRFETGLAEFPKLVRIDAEMTARSDVAEAHPDRAKPE